MKRFIYIWIFLFGIPASLWSQQLPHFTQYMFNDYIMNPAVAGTKNHYQARAMRRFQWAGIIDAPQTISLSFNGPHAKKPMGFGGYLLNDVTGPTSRTGFYGTYAYNFGLGNDIRLSLGLSFGVLQNTIDGTKISLHDLNDPALKEAISTSIVPDASLGAMVYHKKWFAGFSAFQLLSNNLKVYDEKNGLNKLKRHYYLMGGYKWAFAPDFVLEPSLIIKGMVDIPAQIDLNAKVEYMETAWLGFSYRSQDAIAILIGYIHKHKYYFGYSYDITISDFKAYNSGSHEIMIGLRFNNIKE
jgi:type IX secretion system PorP/SprF family membrane protein